MLLRINNVRIPLVSEASLREASARRLGVKKQDIGSIRVLRRAVDARRKSNIVINYHVLADIDAPARLVNRLLRDKDVTRFKEEPAPLPVFGTGTVLLPWAAACLLLGQAPRAVALAALYAVISAVRSFLEPKVMAAQAGLPPLAALAAMYAGFRAFGVAGMILLPVALLFVKQLHDQGYVGLWK